MILLENNKIEINDLKKDIARLEIEQKKIEGRVCELEGKVVNLDKEHSKLQTMTSNLTDVIGKLDTKLDSIVEEIQRLSTQLAVNETRQSFVSKEKNNDKLINSLFKNNNKVLVYLVVILGVGFLFLLGMRAESIAKILGGI